MKSVLIRLNDKMTRLETILDKPSIKYESVEDTLLDKAGYCILAKIEWSKEHE